MNKLSGNNSYTNRTKYNFQYTRYFYYCYIYANNKLVGVYCGWTNNPDINKRLSNPRLFEKKFLYNYDNVTRKIKIIHTVPNITGKEADEYEEFYTKQLINQYPNIPVSGGNLAKYEKYAIGNQTYNILEKNSTIEKLFARNITNRIFKRNKYPEWYTQYSNNFYQLKNELLLFPETAENKILKKCEKMLANGDTRGIGKKYEDMQKIYKPGVERTQGWAYKYMAEFLRDVAEYYR